MLWRARLGLLLVMRRFKVFRFWISLRILLTWVGERFLSRLEMIRLVRLDVRWTTCRIRLWSPDGLRLRLVVSMMLLMTWFGLLVLRNLRRWRATRRVRRRRLLVLWMHRRR